MRKWSVLAVGAGSSPGVDFELFFAFHCFSSRFTGCRVRKRAFWLFGPGGHDHRVSQGALGGFLGVTLGLVSPYRSLLRGSASFYSDKEIMSI